MNEIKIRTVEDIEQYEERPELVSFIYGQRAALGGQFCALNNNQNNILFPCHLHQNNEAWNKSIRIPNPKLLQVGQLCEQKNEIPGGVGQFFE